MLNLLRTRLRAWLGVEAVEAGLAAVGRGSEYFAERDYKACEALNTAIVEQGKSFQKRFDQHERAISTIGSLLPPKKKPRVKAKKSG